MLWRKDVDVLEDVGKQLDDLEREVSAVYSSLVLPTWQKEMHGLPQTLYGYMMQVFAFIDLLSAYWKGTEKDQSKRMLDFMSTYMRTTPEANSVAIQIWRHKLMHTAQPRRLQDARTSKKYHWLLHWHEHLPEEQHYTFSSTNDTRILNVGLMYLIKDLRDALKKYETELLISDELQAKFLKFHTELNSYEYRDIAP